MSDTLLVDELRAIDRAGYSSETVRSARQDKFHARISNNKSPLLQRLCASPTAARESLSFVVSPMIAMNLKLGADRQTCNDEWYRKEVPVIAEKLKGVISFKSGYAMRYADLTRPFDPRDSWREFRLLGLIFGLVVGAIIVTLCIYDPPALAFASYITLGVYIFMMLVLLPSVAAENRRIITSRIALAHRVQKDANYIDNCVFHTFSPSGRRISA